MAHRVAPLAAADLDDIWFYIAAESGSIDVATSFVDSLVDRFFLLSRHPKMGRACDELGLGRRCFSVGEYVIVYGLEDGDVLILRVVHGRRDIGALFRVDGPNIEP